MNIVIVGCGRSGSGLARLLSARRHSVTVIDSNSEAFERLGPTFTGRHITGVGFDRSVLIAAGIADADGLAAVTASDEANVVVARVAREVFGVPRVVARLYDPRQAEIYRRLGLQVIAPVTWGINRLADLLGFTDVGTVASIGTGQVDLVDAELPHLLAGRNIEEITAAGEVTPVAISRSGRTFIPTPETVLRAGDILHLAVVGTSRSRLSSMLGAT